MPVSITHHLNSREPLFQQMVVMGGSSLLMQPFPDFVTEFAYGKLSENLGVSKDPVASQVDKLKSLSAEELVAKTDPSIQLPPTLDCDLILTPASFPHWSEPISSPCSRVPLW